MWVVIIVCIIIVIAVLALSIMTLNKGYGYKHTIDPLPSEQENSEGKEAGTDQTENYTDENKDSDR
ncbi:YtzI protein [Gracilibacillus salitolerans]|uniref:YtzI protein n=1 Tax=Gracilibacillus salitolerans TaxID=2663022 RepID=A0A5Q2TFZ9_9BACI|nr:YtzI protein [Gracilibacillus salitolerans]QGH33061.1 YtzI protein [Gracilibacillus salitolerans]